jgi:hypothetical protein
MLDDNYPPGVSHNSPDAPWNAPDGFECAHCGADVITSENYNRSYYQADADAPETAHGRSNELCKACEDEHSKCVECGEWYIETFAGEWFKPSTARHCPQCAAECIDATARSNVEYETAFNRPRHCAHCGTLTRRGFAFTDGRRPPFAPEFVAVCAACNRTSTRDVFRLMVSFYAEPFAAHCPQCAADADADECGETCYECGRGILEPRILEP